MPHLELTPKTDISSFRKLAIGSWKTTDANGNYRFEKLGPGTVKVHFRTADGRSQNRRVEVAIAPITQG